MSRPSLCAATGLLFALGGPAASAQVPGLVTDINPTVLGAPSLQPAGLRWVGQTLFFAGEAAATGSELYRSFGTPNTTLPVRDLEPGLVGSQPAGFALVGGQILFVTTNSETFATALWRTDGTARGTALVTDLEVLGRATQLTDRVEGIVPLPGGQRGVFAVSSGTVTWIYATDGTAAGTVLLERTVATSRFSAVALGQELVVTDSSLLLVTDGTLGGTRRLVTSGLLPPLAERNGALFFATNTGLWRSDGTQAGTVQLLARPMAHGVVATPSALYALGATGLLRSDGTAAGTVTVRPFSAVPGPAVAVGNDVHFVADDGRSGLELWASDGTLAGTRLLRDLNPGVGGSRFGRLTAVGPRSLAVVDAPGEGTEIMVSDGTAAGTQLVAIEPGPGTSLPGHFALDPAGQRVWFSAYTTAFGRELWVTDGTVRGTGLFADLVTGPPLTAASWPRGFMPLPGSNLFFADDGVRGAELWRTDGTAAGTALVLDIAPGAASSVVDTSVGDRFVVVGGVAYFAANDGASGPELWRSDGTAAGTSRVVDLLPGPAGPLPSYFVALDDERFVFRTLSLGTYVSDGTAAGTVRLATGLASDHGRFGNRVLFSRSDPATGFEPWITDGTPAGTRLLADLVPGSGSSSPYDFVELDGVGYFWTSQASGLWRTDGTAAGTRQVIAMVNQTGSQLTVANGRLYFVGQDAQHGTEPWVSDGTLAGTMLLADTEPGPSGNALRGFIGARGGVLIETGDGVWRTDGTPASTRRLTTNLVYARTATERFVWLATRSGVLRTDGTSVTTVADNVFAVELAVDGHRVLAAVSDPTHGLELWQLDQAATALPFGTGCGAALRVANLTATDPVLGTPVTFTANRFAAGAAVALVLGAANSVVVASGSGCALLVQPIVLTLPVPLRGTSWIVDLPLPANPSLLGVRVAAQALGFPGGSALGVDLSNGVALALGN